MYPSSHLLAETLVADRARNAAYERTVKAARPFELAPRWWRLRAPVPPPKPLATSESAMPPTSA